MNCERVQELLSAYEADDLAHEEQSTIESHLADCPQCQLLLQRLEALTLVADEAAADEELVPSRQEHVLQAIHRALNDDTVQPTGEIWTPEEVASYLKVPVETVYANASTLPFFSFAGNLRIRRDRLVEWIEGEERRNRQLAMSAYVFGK